MYTVIFSSSGTCCSPKLYYFTTSFGLFVRIKEDSFKYFGRSLAECELGCERLEDSLANFSDIGSDISEVGKQLIQLKVRKIYLLMITGYMALRVFRDLIESIVSSHALSQYILTALTLSRNITTESSLHQACMGMNKLT